jgi:hypothetical protein
MTKYREIVCVHIKLLLYTIITLLNSNVIFLSYEQNIGLLHQTYNWFSFFPFFVSRFTTSFPYFQLIIFVLIWNAMLNREAKK